MKLILLSLLVFASLPVFAQSYSDSILAHRQHYKQEFLTDPRSPLNAEDTGYLRFFAPDESYRIPAKLKRTSDEAFFDIPTSSGKNRKYRKYGELQFRIEGNDYSLEVYQSQELLKMDKYKNHLFLPFKDLTNSETTYGGGRYLDLETTDITGDRVIIDFNKAYNPWCAFGRGYSCPIPPDANRLPIAIPAGEMNFAKDTEH